MNHQRHIIKRQLIENNDGVSVVGGKCPNRNKPFFFHTADKIDRQKLHKLQ